MAEELDMAFEMGKLLAEVAALREDFAGMRSDLEEVLRTQQRTCAENNVIFRAVHILLEHQRLLDKAKELSAEFEALHQDSEQRRVIGDRDTDPPPSDA